MPTPETAPETAHPAKVTATALSRNAPLLVLLVLFLAACAPWSLPNPGETTEAQLRERWGAPLQVQEATASTPRTLEYSGQPMGHTNWHVVVDLDGKVLSTEQLLSGKAFAAITEGMPLAEVLRRLGRPMATHYYSLKDQTYYEWRFYDGAQRSDSKIFSAIVSRTNLVVATLSTRDPALDANGGRGRRR